MREIVGGVVRYHDLVAKIKIAKLFSWRVGDSRKICAHENFPLYGIYICGDVKDEVFGYNCLSSRD